MKQKNLLAQEKSLYLQQHASNPVEWHPWGEAAFKKAQQTGKPILLSIGYSACHWCHVMAHESFEDPETAQLMNQYFINIKVDREERPDLDKIYQTALQILTGKAGGWPLTMFLTPDKRLPFFGGTYFPKRSGLGVPNFKEVLKKIAEFYAENPKNIEEITGKIQQSLQQLSHPPRSKESTLSKAPLLQARQQLVHEFDCSNGGFGSAPKFPHPNYLSFLLNDGYHNQHFRKESYAMVSRSLTKMARAGIYDQLSGGFYRYSVDAGWLIPHFEKMLYDNAQLLPLYAQMHLISGYPLFETISLELGSWVLQEMQNPHGGYYSALAADTEGAEGKFYYWDRPQIQKLLSDKEYTLMEKYWGLDLPANFENHWHLFIAQPVETLACESNNSISTIKNIATASRQKLLHERAQRIRPEADAKIVIGWNALMIKGMLSAGLIFKQEKWLASAEHNLSFLLTQAQPLQKSNIFLDDLVFLLDALLQFLQYQWSPTYLQQAKDLADFLLENFYDKENGGFYFTAATHEPLIQRPKYFMDEATPAGNGIAAQCFIRLGYLLDEHRYLQAAVQTCAEAWEAIQSYPASYSSLLLALAEYLNPPSLVILRGDTQSMRKWQQLFYQHYLPDHLCFALPSELSALPPTLEKPAPKQGVHAYICQGKTCQQVLKTEQEFSEYLNQITKNLKL